jgi:hypothetical protein
MKRFILIAVLVGALAALLAGTAFAAGPVTPPAQGFGPGMGMHAPGTGMMTPGMGMGPGGGTRRGAPEWAGQPDEVEKLLGMTDEQVHTERLAGKSLAQIAASKNVSEDKLITEGKLTQAQMDLMVQRMQTQVKTMVERTSVGPAFAQGQTRPNMGQMGQGFRGGRGANR